MTASQWRRGALVALACLFLGRAAPASGQEVPVDTTQAPEKGAGERTLGEGARVPNGEQPRVTERRQGPTWGHFTASPFDTIDSDHFRGRHAFSLDHFLESWPRFVVTRRGPIGADAEFSRYGIGRGRGVLYLGNVSLNDPQDDRVPLGIVPTTAFGAMAAAGAGGRFLPGGANIEGAYRIAEPEAPTETPVAAFDLSKGGRDLRQRRVRLSSVAGPIGIDFEFDELLNNGYGFDARELVSGARYGRTSTRLQGGNLRGELAGGVDYVFSLRRFQSVLNGDLSSAEAELRREGHVAVVRASLDALDFSVFERSHRASAPDSATSNHTAGVLLGVPASWEGAQLSFGAGYEDIRSHQRAGDEARERLQKLHAGAAGRVELPAGVSAALQANATHYADLATGWGAGLGVARALGSRNHALVEVHRRFRMPNLGELFGPRHRLALDPDVEVAGNRSVGAETALEGSAAWIARAGGFANEIRATALRVDDPILYETAAGETSLVTPRNADSEELLVVEDRARIRFSALGAVFEAAGSVAYARGGRERFFEGVPEYRATAFAAVGREVFKNTSGVRLSAEYQYGGRRKAGSVDALDAYGVFNLKFVLRLIDARLYVQWLNVTDEKYQSVWPYLMTPRTFAYGVEWTIFD